MPGVTEVGSHLLAATFTALGSHGIAGLSCNCANCLINDPSLLAACSEEVCGQKCVDPQAVTGCQGSQEQLVVLVHSTRTLCLTRQCAALPFTRGGL
jgi:hypothetical protein